jgi:hypothetical protein
MTKLPEVKTLTNIALRNLFDNAKRLGRQDIVEVVVKEMYDKGIAKSEHYAALSWNTLTVDETLSPFTEISRSIKQNQRTYYTKAGGYKMRGEKWIDSYTAIKTSKINTLFGCTVDYPGAEPVFQLYINNIPHKRYIADELPAALEEWQQIAKLAE